MKLYLIAGLCFVLFSFGNTLSAQDIASFDETLEQAKAENKGVALFLYAGSYNTSTALSDILPDDWSVKTYLERNYISINIDAETPEGQKLAKQYASLGWLPALSFVDQEGMRMVFYSEGDESAEEWAHFFLKSELITGRLQDGE